MVGETSEVGLHVHAENELHGDVTAVHDNEVEVSFNHEFAGKMFVFDIEIIAVQQVHWMVGVVVTRQQN